MSNYALKRFANVDVLRSVSAKHLITFLAPHADYLTSRGITLPDGETEAGPIDYYSLVTALLAPGGDTPTSLIDALYYVNEMTTAQGMDIILRALAREGRFIDEPDSTPVDIAVQGWMMDPGLIERAYARQFVHKPRTFLHYYADSSSRELDHPSEETLRAMESELDDWFQKHKRGRNSRVFVFPRGEDFCFLIRHGEPYTRVPRIQDGESSSLFFQPEKHDVLVYKSGTGELRVNNTTKGIRDLYRRVLGSGLFSGADHFPDNGRYTLEPLRADGAASLVCSDIPGIIDVRLAEVQFEMGGPYNCVRTLRADDLFADLERRCESMPELVPILRASFRVRFSDSKRPRTLVIRPSNVAQYMRDGDGDLIEAWLRARGFLMEEEEADETGDFLVGTY